MSNLAGIPYAGGEAAPSCQNFRSARAAETMVRQQVAADLSWPRSSERSWVLGKNRCRTAATPGPRRALTSW